MPTLPPTSPTPAPTPTPGPTPIPPTPAPTPPPKPHTSCYDDTLCPQNMRCIPAPGLFQMVRRLAMLLPLPVKAYIAKIPLLRKLVAGTCANRALLVEVVV